MESGGVTARQESTWGGTFSRILVFAILGFGLGVVDAHAACAAAPTASTQDTVVQMMANGGSAGVGPVANLTATGEGAVVYSSSAGRLRICDGTNWRTFGRTILGPLATTSGTVAEFTAIPSWAKHVRVMLVGMSTNSTGTPMFQLGTSGGYVTTGYSGTADAATGSSVSSANLSSGFSISASGSAAHTRNGVIDFWQVSGNLWAAGGQWGFGNTDRVAITAGTISLSGTLDRVRLTSTDTFDAGSMYLIYD